MKKLIYTLLILLSFTSCVMDNEPTKYDYLDKVVVAKKEILENGDTKFIISLNDRTSVTVDFGIYSNYELGDTICFKCTEGTENISWYNCVVD